MKQPRIDDKGVSAIVGTLLLISITVMLMATIGLFLFSNIPTTNPVKPNISITSEQTSSGNYMIVIDQVTETIKPGQIIIDLTFSNYSKPAMIQLSGSRIYYAYPAIVDAVTTFYNYNGPISVINASLVFYVYVPHNIHLTYVSFIDKTTDSMVAENSVKLYSGLQSVCPLPWMAYDLSGYTTVPSFSTLNNTNNLPLPTNITMFNPPLANGFEYNSTPFQKHIQPKYVFWGNNISFYFSNLNNSNDYNKGYGAYFISEFNVSSTLKSLNISAYSSEPSFIKIYNTSGFSYYTYLNDSPNGINYANNTTISLDLKPGIYVVYIYYFFTARDGMLAFKMESHF